MTNKNYLCCRKTDKYALKMCGKANRRSVTTRADGVAHGEHKLSHIPPVVLATLVNKVNGWSPTEAGGWVGDPPLRDAAFGSCEN